MADQPVAAMIKDPAAIARQHAGALARSSAAAARREPRVSRRHWPRPPRSRSPPLAGGGIKGGTILQDRRHRLEHRRNPVHVNDPRHHPASVRPRPPSAYLSLSGTGLPVNGCGGQGSSTVARVMRRRWTVANATFSRAAASDSETRGDGRQPSRARRAGARPGGLDGFFRLDAVVVGSAGGRRKRRLSDGDSRRRSRDRIRLRSNSPPTFTSVV